MEKKIIIILAVAIFTLAGVLRLVGLESFSPPLNRDEAAIGYNAYSLLKTGKDEHGVAWPWAFRSIGDYKSPAYIYLTMIPVALWGLSEFSVRIISALSGVFAVIALYYLGRELLKLLGKIEYPYIPLFAAFLLAINPWHIHYSRVGFEANLNLTLFLWLSVFAVLGLKNPRWWILSSLLAVAMQFTYSSSFIFLPALFLSLMILGIWARWEKIKKCMTHIPSRIHFMEKWAIPLIVSTLVLLVGSYLAWQAAFEIAAAKKSITIFSDPNYQYVFNEMRSRMQTYSPLMAKVWLNKPFFTMRTIISNWYDSFAIPFIFYNQIHHPWHAVTGHGFFYWLDGGLFVLGLLWMLKQMIKKNMIVTKVVLTGLLIWLFLSPVAAVITVDAPHATRSLYLIPIFILIASLGLLFIKEHFVNRKWITPVVLSMYGFLLARFLYIYTIQYPLSYHQSFFNGVKSVIRDFSQLETDRLIYFTDVFDSPYLYVLFYDQTEPRVMQKDGVWKPPDTVGLVHIQELGRYRFVQDFPEVKDKAYWVLQGDVKAPPGFEPFKTYRNKKTDQVDWVIYRN